MSIDLKQVEKLMLGHEDEHLEFKEAKTSFSFEKLVKYCAALANERGGRLILGVTDKRPREVVGSQAFNDLEHTKAGLVERLHLRFAVSEVAHPAGRIVIFEVPSRPIGMPIPYKGAYWMRAGEELRTMTPDMLKRIFDEAGPDFSAEICPKARIEDLAPEAVERFRSMWIRKSGNAALRSLSATQLLTDAELIDKDGITYAALILAGTRKALARHLPQAEIILEYRSTDASGPPQQRMEFREGFFLFLDEIWQFVELRNDVQHFQEGLLVSDIPTFSEVTVREAVLNAVSHRDYRLAGSTFVRQFPRRLEVASPGGFPPGVTVENILWRQAPRNRRIAEVFARCGLVERSGQGVNRMFEQSIREGKLRPDFSGSDDYEVALVQHGEVQDPLFVRFLERVGRETLRLFGTEAFLILDLVHREEPIVTNLLPELHRLVDQGIVEVLGRGRGTRYILSRRYYALAGKKGLYTRKRGLDRETNKQLLLKHIRDSVAEGSALGDLLQVLPGQTRGQVQTLLRDLRSEGRVRLVGKTRGGRWFPS